MMCNCNQSETSDVPDKEVCRLIQMKHDKVFCGSLYHLSYEGDCHKPVLYPKQKSGHGIDSSSTIPTKTLKTFRHTIKQTPECQTQFSCSGDKHACFSLLDICMFEIDETDNLVPCVNGDHIESCQNFHCNVNFKCSGSYCIPWEYVCDGKWDCQLGDDETKSSFYHSCKALYKCEKTQQICIHLGNICDGKINCPQGDDELFCELRQVACPQNCSCLGFAVSCDHTSVTFEETENIFVAVSITHCNIASSDFLSNDCQTMFLTIQSSALTQLCLISVCQKLILLDLSTNKVERIAKRCYSSHSQIKTIILENNKIWSMHEESFVDLSNILFLSLKGNLLTHFTSDIFVNCLSLKIINLLENKISFIAELGFNRIQVTLIVTENYHICCVTLEDTGCTAKRPWHISCSDLLPNNTMRTFIIAVSSISCALSIISIVVHIVTYHDNKVFSLVVIFINTGDFLCIGYLTIIWISDLVFHSVFLVKEAQWRTSATYFAAFGTMLWFCIVTQIFLAYLSLCRLMIVVHPIISKFKKVSFVFKSLSIFALVSFLVSLVGTIVVRTVLLELPMSLCLPLVDPTGELVMLHVITGFAVASQTITSISIVFMHVHLVFSLSRQKQEMQGKRGKRTSSKGRVIQLIVLTTSNILCWYPANVIYLTAYFLPMYPTSLVIWSVVAIVPLNSIVNPTVFLSVEIQKFVLFRIGASL